MCRVRVDDARNQDVRELREISSERRCIARFGSVIQLIAQRSLDLLHDADHVDALAC